MTWPAFARAVVLFSIMVVIAAPAKLPARDGHVIVHEGPGGCKITIRAATLVRITAKSAKVINRDTPEGRADAEKVWATLVSAETLSQDMFRKMRDACKAHRRKIQILVLRNDKEVFAGRAWPGAKKGLLALDLAEIEAIPDYLLKGNAAARKRVADTWMVDALAHELDHLRDAPGETAHADPAAGDMSTMTGPAVDDANTVKQEIGLPADRVSYTSVVDSGGIAEQGLKFKVGNRTVEYRVSTHQTDAESSTKSSASGLTRSFELPGSIPARPCPSSENCYRRADARDQDLDTVVDRKDNCPSVPNPQQGDTDGDGTGDACTESGGDVAALQLNFPHGSLPTGATVPLSCIVGGVQEPAHAGGCSCTHLHDVISETTSLATPITIVGLGDFFEDVECGHGCIVTAKETELSYTCS